MWPSTALDQLYIQALRVGNDDSTYYHRDNEKWIHTINPEQKTVEPEDKTMKANSLIEIRPDIMLGKPVIKGNGERIITIPRANPVNAFTMGGIIHTKTFCEPNHVKWLRVFSCTLLYISDILFSKIFNRTPLANMLHMCNWVGR